jgi:hypothetical protein
MADGVMAHPHHSVTQASVSLLSGGKDVVVVVVVVTMVVVRTCMRQWVLTGTWVC